jgi:hypothetical protein
VTAHCRDPGQLKSDITGPQNTPWSGGVGPPVTFSGGCMSIARVNSKPHQEVWNTPRKGLAADRPAPRSPSGLEAVRPPGDRSNAPAALRRGGVALALIRFSARDCRRSGLAKTSPAVNSKSATPDVCSTTARSDRPHTSIACRSRHPLKGARTSRNLPQARGCIPLLAMSPPALSFHPLDRAARQLDGH